MMDKQPDPQAPYPIRPVGNLERCSTARHHLGYYRCVAITAKYRTLTSPQLLHSVIETAIAKTILSHPLLCCGIINEDKKNPAFVGLPSINLSEVIKYHVTDVDAREEDGIVGLIEWQHRQLFSDLESKPGWRVVIVPERKVDDSPGAAFDVLFAWHHALADGLSGMVFHRSLLEALNDTAPCPQLTAHILSIPALVEIPKAVEDIVDFRLSWPFFLKALWGHFWPKWLKFQPELPWAGEKILQETVEKYDSRAKLIVIPSELVSPILAACREQKATITGLLHGLVLASLTAHVPQASKFCSGTPYSIRGATGMSSTEEMGNQVSGFSSEYDTKRMRVTTTPDQVAQEIWDIARKFRQDMSAEIARLPKDNLIGMLPYVSDYLDLYSSRIGNPRAETYEISNVGSIERSEPGSKWNIERVIFSQPGMGTGPAMGFSVTSVVGGPLTVTVTWLEGDVSAALMDLITKDIDYALRCITQGRELIIGS